MKPATVFLTFLCFFLLRMHGPVYAAAEKPRIAISGVAKDFTQVKQGKLDEKKEELLNFEDEEDEVVSSRKFAWAIRYFMMLACASFLFSYYSNVKNRLPFCKHFSYISTYKYLLQRVLRI